jgi:hypothetical protein
MFPVHDWQFWVAMLLVVLSFAYLVRMLVQAGRAATPCHCGKSLDTDPAEPKPVSLTVSAGGCDACKHN